MTVSNQRDSIITPNGAIELPCEGVPVAFSRHPDRMAITCEDGRLLLFTSGGALIGETPGAFLLEGSGIAGSGENLEAFGFRGGGRGEGTPFLRAHNLDRGGVRSVALPPGYTDSATEFAAVEDQGACLLLARRTFPGVRSLPEMDMFEIAVFPRVSPPEQPVVFSDRPSLTIQVDGFIVPGLGRQDGSLVRCVDGDTDDPKVVAIHRFQPARNTIYYEIAIHTLAGRRVVHAHGDWFKIVNRAKGAQVAMIDVGTGRLAVLDVRAGAFAWVYNREGRIWLDYDLDTASGIAIQTGGAENVLVMVDCEIDAVPCRETLVEPSVSTRLYGANMTASSGAGHLIRFERVLSAADQNSQGMFYRWQFK